jgi:hypothetical protein
MAEPLPDWTPSPEDLPAEDEMWADVPTYSSTLSGSRPEQVERIHQLIAETEPPTLRALDDIDMPLVPIEEQRHLAALIADGLQDPGPWPLPEDRGLARLSALGEVWYVDGLLRPGRIVVVAAEEGTGKSYAISGELGIRLAAAGGSFAGTWPVLVNGPVLVLSEMHRDDDFERESTITRSLGLERESLKGSYFRLDLMTAAGDKPALMVDEWRDWITGWLRKREAVLLVVDTATGATQIKPWGEEIQAVYRSLRRMLEAVPALAVVLVLHMRKPTGKGDRRLSDVMGEWGRWCDVVVLMENEGSNLDHVRITVRKRVPRERRIVATKTGGLLVDAKDIAMAGPKVPGEKVLAAVQANPGLTMAELATAIGVSKDTAARYVKALPTELETIKGTARSGPGAAVRVHLIAASPQINAQARASMGAATGGQGSPHAARTYISAATPASIDEDLAEMAKDVDAEALI